jgi:hypothetical protein
LRTAFVPASKEIDDAASSYEQHESVSSVVFEMLAVNVVTLLPPGENPMVVSPLKIVPRPETGKFGLTVNIPYVTRHLGLKGLQVSRNEVPGCSGGYGDHAVSYDQLSGYYHVSLHPRSRTFVGF